MSYEFQLELHADMAHIDDFLDFMCSNFRHSIAHQGCISIDPIRDVDDPAHFIFLQTWETEEDYRNYSTWRAETGTKIPDNILDAPRRLRVVERLA